MLEQNISRDSSIYAPGCKASKAVLGQSNLNSHLLEELIAFQSFKYEVWHGRKPIVNHFRVFGSDTYAHIPKNERAKLDSKM